MHTVHCVLQGKGGVGKSFVSTLLAQYLMSREQPVLCIDTDPINATFTTYNALTAQHLRLMHDETFDYEAFDALLMRLLDAQSPVVIDNGAASFGAMVAALADNAAATLLAEHGKALLLHSVIAGADNLADTVHGFDHTAERLPAPTPIIVWLNAYHGPVRHAGKGFEQMQAYERHQGRIQGVVHLHKHKPHFEADLHLMLQHRLTFDQTMTSAAFNVLQKSRLKRLQTAYFNQLAVVLGPESLAYAEPAEESGHVGA